MIIPKTQVQKLKKKIIIITIFFLQLSEFFSKNSTAKGKFCQWFGNFKLYTTSNKYLSKNELQANMRWLHFNSPLIASNWKADLTGFKTCHKLEFTK